MRIELPWPAAALSPNRKNGSHWATVHAIKGKRVAGARVLAMTATFCPPDKRRRDLDNLLAAMKPDFDGISQALGVDDHHFHPLTLRRGEKVENGCVVLEIGC